MRHVRLLLALLSPPVAAACGRVLDSEERPKVEDGGASDGGGTGGSSGADGSSASSSSGGSASRSRGSSSGSGSSGASGASSSGSSGSGGSSSSAASSSSNGAPVLPQCAAPTFMPNGGRVTLGAVTIIPPPGFPVNFPAGNAVIFYTTDGTVPTHASPVYSGPIQMSEALTIRAIAYYPDVCSDSTVALVVFTVAPGTGSGSSSGGSDSGSSGSSSPVDAGVCTPGATQCSDVSTVQTCNATGQDAPWPCASGTCSGGACTGSTTSGTSCEGLSGPGLNDCGAARLARRRRPSRRSYPPWPDLAAG